MPLLYFIYLAILYGKGYDAILEQVRLNPYNNNFIKTFFKISNFHNDKRNHNLLICIFWNHP